MGFVYFMVGRYRGHAAIKIGSSWKPRLRAVAVAREICGQVEVYSNIPMGEMSPFEERKLHRRFAKDRIGGEWFHLSRELFDLIEWARKFPIDPWPERDLWHG